VNIQFSNGATASFTLIAFTEAICERQVRLHFTHGELIGDMSKFTVTNFRTGITQSHRPVLEEGGHGGGDLGLVKCFVDAVRSHDQSLLGTTASEVLKSHLAVFAAEHARRENKVVDYPEFERNANSKYQTNQQ